jgi:membrane-associated phospholipid phosphatase
VPWRSLAWTFGFGVLLIAFLFRWDVELMRRRSQLPQVPAHMAANILSRSAHGLWMFPTALVAAVGFSRVGRRRASRTVQAMIVGAVVAGCLANVARSMIGRTRPEVPVEQGWFGPIRNGELVAGRYAYSSFPSGHTSAAAGFALVLMCVSRRWGVVGGLYALGVAWSRVQLGAHRPSDVAAGLLLGAVVTLWMSATYRRWIEGNVGSPS